ncbi:MAG: type II secretion system F family protein [Xanthobacteraceae bacterium]
MRLNIIAVFFLVSAAIGGLFWVFIYPIVSGDRKAERRRLEVAQTDPGMRKSVAKAPSSKVRREQVEETLKELDQRSKKLRSPPLNTRIQQAGLRWSKQTYYIVSVILGLVIFLALIIFSVNIIYSATTGLAVAVCIPRWTLSFLKKRRETKFIEGFADAVDVITRGIKAGLPLLDSIKIIVTDSPEPIRSEFKAIVDTQAIGMPLGEACAKLYERMPLAEANFFGIVVSIQQKAGGNLSEALGNLSRVLRDRKKMKAKIKAMSQEAKASAGIIGALPPLVMVLLYITSPDYISLLWQHRIGHLMLGGSVVWMTAGVLVMKKMINFNF